jgi:YD repeat-containing protein
MGYDGQGQLRWTQRPDGQFTVVDVDGLGRPITTIQNYQDGTVATNEPPDRDLVTRTAYDMAGRRVQTSAPDGTVTAWGYDLQDRLTRVTTHATQSGCGGLGQEPLPCNVVTQYRYDRAGNRTAITDANGHTRTVHYDAADQVDAATDALGRTTTYQYNARGQVTGVDDPRPNLALTWQYDALGHLVEAQSIHPGLGLIRAHHTYDADGRRTALRDDTGTTSFRYDALDRLTQVQAPSGTVGYGYDARGLARA